MKIYNINVNAVIEKIFSNSGFFLMMLFSCSSPISSNDSEKIQAVMQQQEKAWNRGDIDEFMEGYWKSDSLIFIGKSGIKYGWKNTLNNYKKSYPSRSKMGMLKFKNLKIELLDGKNAYVIGNWTLSRETDTIGGHYSLRWKKMGGNWFIVADHSS
ncbi:MAG: nuclear transport factor 2 family protein [Flavobacteriales bacterium]|nr:nuclear transport factor 2 family protein [Flavobacteriales bacterium]